MNKSKWRSVVGIFVYMMLLFSIVYAIINIIKTEDSNARSNYVLMLIQCCLGIVVYGLPAVIEREFSFELPNSMSIAYFVFLYCAIYLGEVRNFYFLIPHWDNILHCFSGAMLGALGFSLVKILNDSDKVEVQLNPYFVCLFALCFAVAAGAVWEIYEFAGDSLLNLNMQKFRLEDGTLLMGADAIRDTMQDLIIDTVGALVIVVVGFFNMKIAKNKEPILKEETKSELIKK